MTILAVDGLNYLLQNYEFDSVLDVGCGPGYHSDIFKQHGKNVTAVDISSNYDVKANYNTTVFDPHDIVWASHILEHQLNIHSFLTKVRSEVKDDGFACITVPPLKHEIVGGHLTLWNAGLVCYNMVLAGFNCRNASIRSYGYNITVIAPADNFELPNLNYDNGDIEKLEPWLPTVIKHGVSGQIEKYNW